MTRLFMHEDLARSFQAEPALTVGDACRWDFPGQKFTYLTQTEFEIRITN